MYDGKATPNMKHFIAAGTANTSSSPCWFLTHAFLPFCLTAEPGDAEVDDDDEIEIGAQQSDFKCPITLTLLKDPMTSCVLPSLNDSHLSPLSLSLLTFLSIPPLL